MKYVDLESIISAVRLQKYLAAANHNTKRAQKLYRKNIELAHEFYSIQGLFEVALRNAVNNHYTNHFRDANWMTSQLVTGYFSFPELRKSRAQIFTSIDQLGQSFTHDKLVSSLSLGFWVHMFDKGAFNHGGKSLLQGLPSRPHGLNQKTIFKTFQSIRDWRNRVAHFEPLCFYDGIKSTTTAREQYQHICNAITWMGIDSKKYFYGLDHVLKVCDQIDIL